MTARVTLVAETGYTVTKIPDKPLRQWSRKDHPSIKPTKWWVCSRCRKKGDPYMQNCPYPANKEAQSLVDIDSTRLGNF